MNASFPDRKIICINKTASTNGYLLRLADTDNVAEGTVVITDCQTHGRGQGNHRWESEPGANLTFSILFFPLHISAVEQFILSQALSLAVFDFISGFVHSVSVKWPNDVYVGNGKIAGILIENFVGGAYLKKTVAGIGVNINQMRFVEGAPNPVSLRQLTGQTYALENCLNALLDCIDTRYKMLNENANQLKTDYLQHLYRMGVRSRFSADGITFHAVITGVNRYGMLEMVDDSSNYKSFGFKEIKFL